MQLIIRWYHRGAEDLQLQLYFLFGEENRTIRPLTGVHLRTSTTTTKTIALNIGIQCVTLATVLYCISIARNKDFLAFQNGSSLGVYAWAAHKHRYEEHAYFCSTALE